MATLGYARVSTQDQNLAGQLAALEGAGATTIFREKVSGVRSDRPQLAKLMAVLGVADLVVVTKLDRLGRLTRELLDLIDRISKAGASFRSLGDPLWDTGSPQGRLLSTLLAAIAEFERELIRERTGEGGSVPWPTGCGSAGSQSCRHSSVPRPSSAVPQMNV
jgi:DNA invertase Pin-like site-specific DNA recombinase